MRTIPLILVVTVLALAASAAEVPLNWPLPTPPPGANPATFAVPRNEWLVKVQTNLERARAPEPIDLLFEGDSITEGWKTAGREVWQSRYGGLHAATFGISADRTEHVLWRIRNGQMDGISPKLIVLMIGTNNLGRDTVEQVAEGVAVITQELLARCPSSRVLVLGIFPRGARPDAPIRTKIKEVNRRIAELASHERVEYLDIGDRLLKPDGTLGVDIMPDLLHPARPGYEIWANAIQPVIDRFIR
ncbi:MAG TPA: GDSL-type esterase/lipase family protein [Opitutaceae bacterium]